MTRWNWVEDFVLPVAVAVLNAAWVWLWLLWSVRAAPPAVPAQPFSPLLLGLLLLGGVAVTRLALSREGRPLGQRLVVTLAGILAVSVATWQTYGFRGTAELIHSLVNPDDLLSPVVLGWLACAYLWWQGIRLARSHLPQEYLERSFYGGILALGLLFAVNQPRPLIGPGEALAAVLAFFAVGLGGLALVSVENARRWEEGLGGAWPALNRYWLGTVAAVIGSILLAGLVVASLLSPHAFDRLRAITEIVANAVTIVLVLVIGSLFIVATWLLSPLIDLIARAFSQADVKLPPPPDVQKVLPQTVDFFASNPALDYARQGLLLIVILGLVVLVFWWAARRFSRIARRDVDETRESIATPELLFDQLRNLFRRRPAAASPEPPFLSLSGPDDDPRLMVRRAYRAMLELALGLSLPRRQAGQTPAAYAETLRLALPEGGPAIDTLTGAYVQARYAAEAPSLELAQSALGAINQLRSLTSRTNRFSTARRPA